MKRRIEASETITRYVEALFEACRPLERNEVLTHDVIRGVLGDEVDEDTRKYCIIKLKRRMEDERGITIWSEYGIGYRLLTKDEQLTLVPRVRLRRARRQYRKAQRSVAALPDRQLTVHQRRVKHGQEEALRQSMERMAEDARRQVAFMRPLEGRPRPRDEAVRPVEVGGNA